MSESILFKDICVKMEIPEDKFVSQCFKTLEKTGIFDLSSYTPSVQTCEALSKVLSKSNSIVKLIARDSLLPPKGIATILASLKRCRLTDVCLTGNNISSETTVYLANAVKDHAYIKILILKWNNIGLCKKSFKTFCSCLAKNTYIENIDLRSNQISGDSVADLSRLLSNNTSLKKLDLRWNLLDSKATESLLSLLENNQTKVNILLGGNLISPQVVSNLGNYNKYKDDLKSIQTTYKAKLLLLTNHIKQIEDKRVDHVKRLYKNSEKLMKNAELKINEVSGQLVIKETEFNELSHKLKETEINYNSEKVRTNILENMIEEKENNYLDLINKYQLTIETLRQELLKVENDIADKRVEDEKKYFEEKRRREEAENEREYFMKMTEMLKENLNKVIHEYETTTKIQIENLEKEKLSWQCKYNDLEKRTSNELNHLTELAADRQKKLERTILDLTENQTKNMEAVSEKLEYCLGEKATVEGQLTSTLALVSRLQQENSDLLNQLSQPSRRLAHVLQELADEKVSNEKLRLEKLEVERKLEESRKNWSILKEEMALASEAAAETSRNQKQQVQTVKTKALLLAHKLKERDRLIDAIKEEERKRAVGLYTAVTNYMERLPNSTEKHVNAE